MIFVDGVFTSGTGLVPVVNGTTSNAPMALIAVANGEPGTTCEAAR
jgi:hypothetical protein